MLHLAAKYLFPASVLSQDSSVREFLDGTFAVKPSKEPEGSLSIGHPSSSRSGQNSSAPAQGGGTFNSGGSGINIGQDTSASAPGRSPFKTGGSGSGGSTVTTGVPAFTQKQGMTTQCPLLSSRVMFVAASTNGLCCVLSDWSELQQTELQHLAACVKIAVTCFDRILSHMTAGVHHLSAQLFDGRNSSQVSFACPSKPICMAVS